jgi:long-chain acyl-CoA synthetase
MTQTFDLKTILSIIIKYASIIFLGVIIFRITANVLIEFLHKRVTQPVNVPVGEKKPGETQAYRNINDPNLITEHPDLEDQNLYSILKKVAKDYPERNCFGYRECIKITVEPKEVVSIENNKKVTKVKNWKYFTYSDYKWLTYKEVEKMTIDGCSGLAKLGCQPGQTIMLFSPTSHIWNITAFSAFRRGMIIATCYDTLGPEGLQYSLNEVEASVLYTNVALLPTISKIAAQCPYLKTIIYDDDKTADLKNLDDFKAAYPNLNLISFNDLLVLGSTNYVDETKTGATDIACIMYTSGSTGVPKGVKISNENFVTTIYGAERWLDHLKGGLSGDDIYIGYLPLAHILEMIMEYAIISVGVSIGYGRPQTLTDGSMRDCKGDIKALRPTLMPGVPLVWDKICKAVIRTINKKPLFIRFLFHTTFNTDYWLIKHRLPRTPLGKIFYKQIRQETGGRLRLSLVGGAPINKNIYKFINTVLCPMSQGYGMTEICGVISLQPIYGVVEGEVGAPFINSEYKLVDIPESNYLTTNKPYPQGEVWVRGTNVCVGYLNHPELNSESRTEDGWFKTGDIGEIRENNALALIDRKKSLIKLANGEYIAVEYLECVYKSSLIVDNICVYGKSFENYPIALVVPNERELFELAVSKHICASIQDAKSMPFKDLCNNQMIKVEVLKNLQSIAFANNLKSAEIVKNVILCPSPWTIEAGLITPANKLKRNAIVNQFKKEIDACYI